MYCPQMDVINQITIDPPLRIANNLTSEPCDNVESAACCHLPQLGEGKRTNNELESGSAILSRYVSASNTERIISCSDSTSASRSSQGGTSLSDLPIELVWLILRAIDDHRSLFACLLTCHALNKIAYKIIKERFSISVRTQAGLSKLTLRLKNDPLLGYLLRRVVLGLNYFPVFVIRFMNRLRSVYSLSLHASTSTRMPPFRMQTSHLFSQFRSITLLQLLNVRFDKFTDCARLLRTLPNLQNLGLGNAFYINDNCGSQSVLEKDTSRDLNLRSLVVVSPVHYGMATQLCMCLQLGHQPLAHPACGIFHHLLSAPQLSSSLCHLTVFMDDEHLEWMFDMLQDRTRSHPLTFRTFTSLHTLTITLNVTSAGPRNALPVVLSTLTSPNARVLDITYDYQKCHQYQFARIASIGSSSCFSELDLVLGSSCFQHLERVIVRLLGLLDKDVDHLSSVLLDELPFSTLRQKNILELHVLSRASASSVMIFPPSTSIETHITENS